MANDIKFLTEAQAVELLKSQVRERIEAFALEIEELRKREVKKAIIPPHKHTPGASVSSGVEDIAPGKLNPKGIDKGEESPSEETSSPGRGPHEETPGEMCKEEYCKNEMCKTHSLDKGAKGPESKDFPNVKVTRLPPGKAKGTYEGLSDPKGEYGTAGGSKPSLDRYDKLTVHKDEMLSKPPVSEAQRAAMGAAAGGKSTLGIPKKVGKEFINADKGGKLPAKKAELTDAKGNRYTNSKLPGTAPDDKDSEKVNEPKFDSEKAGSGGKTKTNKLGKSLKDLHFSALSKSLKEPKDATLEVVTSQTPVKKEEFKGQSSLGSAIKDLKSKTKVTSAMNTLRAGTAQGKANAAPALSPAAATPVKKDAMVPTAKPPSGVNMSTHVPTSKPKPAPKAMGGGTAPAMKTDMDGGFPAVTHQDSVAPVAKGVLAEGAKASNPLNAAFAAAKPGPVAPKTKMPSPGDQAARAASFQAAGAGEFQPSGPVTGGLELDIKPKAGVPALSSPKAAGVAVAAKPGIFGRLAAKAKP